MTVSSLITILAFMPALAAAAPDVSGRVSNDSRPGPRRVLVLNAYHLSHPWTEDVNRGLNEKFNTASFEVEVWTEFMDVRRRTEATRFDAIEHHLAETLGHLRFDLIVAVDDDAVRFLLERGDRLFRNTPVTYCGVSAPSVLEFAARKGWAGLIEHSPVDSWVDLALRLRPENRRLVVVTDNSEANRLRRDGFKVIAGKGTDLQFDFLDGQQMSLSEILKALRQVAPLAVVIATTYSRAPDGSYVSPWESGRAMAEASKAPILSPNSRYLGNGILAGNADAGRSHGLLAAEMGLQILRDGKAAAGTRQTTPTATVVDHSLLKRFNLTVDDWPPGTTFVNRDPTWRDIYFQYRWWIRGATLLILLQSFVTAALVVSRRRLRRAEAELIRTHDRLVRGQEIARLGTWERNLTTGLLNWSDEVFRIYGLEPGGIVPTIEFVMSAIHTEDLAEVKRTIDEADRAQTGRNMEYRMLRSDGSVRHLRIQAKPQINARGEKLLMGTVQDVTEVHQMEEQVRHAQRMESVGNLAGGVAHDFNNLLTVINGYSDLLLGRLQSDSTAHGPLTEIRKAGAKAADLTGKLLAFSRKQVIRPAPLDLNEALLAMDGLLKPILGDSINLRYELQPELPQAFLDYAHLEQSILNLAANSHDAMTAGGDFTLRTRLTETLGEPGKQWIEILISDTGEGMDEATQKRIFDPFFTTKPKGKGTGLGLASVYGFVNQSGGHLDVESAPGEGTTMILRLPVAARHDNADSAAGSPI